MNKSYELLVGTTKIILREFVSCLRTENDFVIFYKTDGKHR